MAVRRLRPLLALGIVCVGVVASTAHADRPKIAVLGLEVQTNGATADPESTKIAKWLTQGLRNRATSGRGQYQLAPNSARELIDEKLMKGCENEKPDCMAQIGGDMQADFLLFGRIDKMIKNDISVFQVTLKLLDVHDKKELPSFKQFLPVNTAKAQEQAQLWAAEAYGAITHETKDAVVIAPKESKEPAIVPKDRPIEPKPTPGQPRDESNGWRLPAKVGLYTSIGTGIGFLATWAPLAIKGKSSSITKWGSDCPKEGGGGFVCEHGSTLATGMTVFGIGFLASATFTGFAYYMSSRSGGRESQPTTGRVKKERTFVVTPVVAPDGAGATVRFDW